VRGESGVGPNTTIPGNCLSDLAACCGRRQEGRSGKSKLQLHEYKVKLTDTSVGKVRRILQGAAVLGWAAVTDAGWAGVEWDGFFIFVCAGSCLSAIAIGDTSVYYIWYAKGCPMADKPWHRACLSTRDVGVVKVQTRAAPEVQSGKILLDQSRQI